MSQLITINLSKSPGASWGFRLQGGKDFAQPLCVQKVNVGSIAENAGLQAGDAIVSIGSSDALSLRHKEAQDTIVKCGNSFQMVVQRGSMTWRPQVTALSQPKNTIQGPVATQTSLAAKQPPKPRMPKGFNATPQNFGEVNGQKIVNPQFNSPINIYSEDSLAEALTSQSEVLNNKCLGVNFKKNERNLCDSDVFKMVHEMDMGPKTPPVVGGSQRPLTPSAGTAVSSAYTAPLTPGEMIGTPEVPTQGQSFKILERYLENEERCGSPRLPSSAPKSPAASSGGYQLTPGQNICAECERLIVGVFVRVKDKNLHAECFKCNTCATSLKNVGYYNINDKLYCDVHAKQAAKHNPPGPNLVPVTVKPGAPAPAGAFPAAAALHQSSVKPPPGGVRTPFSSVPNYGGPATPYKPVQASTAGSGGSSANPAAFGAPSGGIDVRSHIPKKGPSSPAPSFITPKPASAPAPAPSFIAPPKQAAVPAPSFITPKPAAPAPAPAPVFNSPAPSAMFGGGGMPKPAPPPGMPGLGGIPKAPGIGGKGVAGQRTAPKRGRGVMNPAQASRIPVCAGCQRQIRGPFVTALGKNWCPDHFHCATDTCRKPLIEVGFVEEQGRLHCEDCYERFLAPTCGKCDKRIKGDCLNAVGKQFHPECFCCAYCGKIFGSGAFYLEDGLPYCETDWNDLFTTKCVGCGFPIEAGDRWVEALNNNYHSQCFKCSKCHKNLEGQSFFAKGGKPFCKAHAQRGF